MSTKPSLPGGNNVLWTLTLFFTVLTLFYTFWAVTASNFQHTHLRPSTAPTGSLYSERFTADFFFTGSLLLLFFVSLSFAWILANPYNETKQIVHIVFTMLLFIYMVVILLFWGIGMYSTANRAEAGNANNPANDDKWCSVNFGIAGTACANTAGIVGVTQESLTIDPVFLYKFWFLLVFIVLVALHIIYCLWAFRQLNQAVPQEQEEQVQTAAVGTRMKFRIPYQGRK